MFFGASGEVVFCNPRAECLTGAGGGVGDSLIVAGGSSGRGEGCSIGLSGVVRPSPASGAAGGQSGSASQIIDRLAGGVTGAPCREVNSKVATAPNTQSRR